MEAGIRELRATLSRWVKRVRDRGEVIGSDRAEYAEDKIDCLIREGLVIPAPRPWRGPLPEPIEGAGPLSDLVLDGRR
jgi:hypothetical protein